MTLTLGGQNHIFSYGYNLAGQLTYEAYPSGRTISTGFDTTGRRNQVSGTLNNTTTNYLTYVIYGAHGMPTLEWFGNNVTRTMWFNSRLQPYLLWDDVNNDGNQFLFIENPICWGQSDPNCSANTGNNGNAWGMLLFEGGPSPWENWGTMWVSGWQGISPAPGTPTSNAYNSHNQISGASYDAAGNLTANLTFGYTYDAENRLTSVSNSNGPSASYQYEGFGSCAEDVGNTTTAYIYDAFGNLAAEYTTSGTLRYARPRSPLRNVSRARARIPWRASSNAWRTVAEVLHVSDA